MLSTALDHVTIVTDDFEASRPVYDAVLGALDLVASVDHIDPEEESEDPDTVAAIGYSAPEGRPVLVLAAGPRPTRHAHVALTTSLPSVVDAVFAVAQAAGISIVQAPRQWEADHLGYYGVQLADPAGNMIEVFSRA
ncbi:VOC family protein [Jatrophihabitans telluris]|uniref:VOC family protein n=1 Tax=Jatrophihabitans telluris TaxID=2038343 RepID=A0ABY4R2L9_9ACTN|nr:VOC family protein [Jatrophihabitans telluris]UQX90153.1 VOC family protein [Jatrophihabitans telluris]